MSGPYCVHSESSLRWQKTSGAIARPTASLKRQCWWHTVWKSPVLAHWNICSASIVLPDIFYVQPDDRELLTVHVHQPSHISTILYVSLKLVVLLWVLMCATSSLFVNKMSSVCGQQVINETHTLLDMSLSAVRHRSVMTSLSQTDCRWRQMMCLSAS